MSCHIALWVFHSKFSPNIFFLTAVRAPATDDLSSDHSPLARLSLDKRFARNGTKLSLFAVGLKTLPGMCNSATYLTTPRAEPMSRCIAHSLKSFSNLRELKLVVHAKRHSVEICTGEWGSEDQLVPFQFCSEGDCNPCAMLVPGLVMKGQVEWGLKGVENGPVIKFVCLKRKEASSNDIKGSDG
jgi:hypothetical protein